MVKIFICVQEYIAMQMLRYGKTILIQKLQKSSKLIRNCMSRG